LEGAGKERRREAGGKGERINSKVLFPNADRPQAQPL
jgi:hypothetical protein